MKNTLLLVGILALASCVPENFGKEMGNAVAKMQQMMADQEFKRAIAHIELHKIRNGHYPSTLDSLEFINPMDSPFLSHVEYLPMDSVYGLNLTHPVVNMKKSSSQPPMKANYPDKFWQGLGCVQSNMK